MSKIDESKLPLQLQLPYLVTSIYFKKVSSNCRINLFVNVSSKAFKMNRQPSCRNGSEMVILGSILSLQHVHLLFLKCAAQTLITIQRCWMNELYTLEDIHISLIYQKNQTAVTAQVLGSSHIVSTYQVSHSVQAVYIPPCIFIAKTAAIWFAHAASA